MDEQQYIEWYSSPVEWVKNIYRNGISSKGLFFTALIPAIMALFGLISDIHSLVSSNNRYAVTLLYWFIFIYGLINMVMIILLQRARIRFIREEENYEILHKNIIEKFRNYLFEKANSKKSLTDDIIKTYLVGMLNSVVDFYLKSLHGKKVAGVIKYQIGDNIYSIRAGFDVSKRSNQSSVECISNSYVNQILNKKHKKLSFIHVKNIDDPDKFERQALGEHTEEIQKAALNKYKSFIALPIRSGNKENCAPDNFNIKRDFGFVGFDLPIKNGFGNFRDDRFNILACFADLISEMVKDLVEIQKEKVEASNVA